MEFKFENPITKDYLLSQFSEEVYLCYYLSLDKLPRSLFKSPLRADQHPTCSFYKSKTTNEIMFKDFGNGFTGNFVSVVMEKFQVGYHEALNIIAEDFHLKSGKHDKKVVIGSNNTFTFSGPSKIEIEEKEFSPEELSWWEEYGITLKMLKKFNVHSCKTVFLNGNINSQSTSNCPIYGYYLGKKGENQLWRIYFPKKKTFRFLSNTPAKLIQGYYQLPKKGKLLVITKSMKDTIALYAFGIPAIAPNSENLFVPEDMLAELKKRFTHIVVFFDQDRPGLMNMAKIRHSHPELSYFVIPKRCKAKDFSDLVKKYGSEKVKKMIEIGIKFLKNQWVEGTKNSELKS